MTQPTHLNIDAIVERYIQMRDMKDKLKKELDAKTETLTAAMDKCEGVILQHLNSMGADSIRSASGTVFKSSTTSATVADWDQTLNWIKENEFWHFLERKVNKTAVADFKEAQSDLPPGVQWKEATVVRVRRAA